VQILNQHLVFPLIQHVPDILHKTDFKIMIITIIITIIYEFVQHIFHEEMVKCPSQFKKKLSK